jgi:hypothetical protein
MEREAVQTPLSDAKVKNEWSYYSTPQYATMDCTGQLQFFTINSFSPNTRQNDGNHLFWIANEQTLRPPEFKMFIYTG